MNMLRKDVDNSTGLTLWKSGGPNGRKEGRESRVEPTPGNRTGPEAGSGEMRICMISSYPSQKCGIATFTQNLRNALLSTGLPVSIDVVAVASDPEKIRYPSEVVRTIRKDSWSSYEEAISFIDEQDYDAISLQHEFGLFGGPEGAYIVDMLRRMRTPVTTTLHTLLAEPSQAYSTRTRELLDVSTAIVTLTPSGKRLIESSYGASRSNVAVIPHGIPDLPFVLPEERKGEWGFEDRTVLLTFGLIGPSKGIEVMLDALPGIVKDHPDLLYVVAGATHPGVLANEGEGYRNRLKEQSRRLGIERNVSFIDRYLEDSDLHSLLQACDIYVTPYQNRDQISSGTLSYALGAGRALVSTPYWYAVDLLSGGRGRLVDFGSSSRLTSAISRLISDEEERTTIYRRAYEFSRSMTWSVVAETYLELFESLVSSPDRQTHENDLIVATP